MLNKDLIFEICCYLRLKGVRSFLQTNKNFFTCYTKSFWSSLLTRNIENDEYFYDIFYREGGNNLNEIEIYLDVLMTRPELSQKIRFDIVSTTKDLINSYDLIMSINGGFPCERYTNIIRKYLFLFNSLFNEIQHIILGSSACLLSGITQEVAMYIDKGRNDSIYINNIKWSICFHLPHILLQPNVNAKEVFLAYGIDIPVCSSNYRSMMKTCKTKFTKESIDSYLSLTGDRDSRKEYNLDPITKYTKITHKHNKVHQLLQEEALKLYLEKTGSRKTHLNIIGYTRFMNDVMDNCDYVLFSYLVRNGCLPTLCNIKTFISNIFSKVLIELSWFKILKLSLEEVSLCKTDKRGLIRDILIFLEKLLELPLSKEERCTVIDMTRNFLNRLKNTDNKTYVKVSFL